MRLRVVLQAQTQQSGGKEIEPGTEEDELLGVRNLGSRDLGTQQQDTGLPCQDPVAEHSWLLESSGWTVRQVGELRSNVALGPRVWS